MKNDYPTLYNISKDSHGQSLIEVLIAMAIFSLISASLVSLSLGGYNLLIEASRYTEAEYLAQEAIEGVRAIRDRAWNELVYDRSAVTVNDNQWQLSGSGTTEQIGQFSRTVDFFPIYRDDTNAMVSATATNAHLDIQSKKVVASISWIPRGSIHNSVEREIYLTNWASQEWTQTDWVGGSGQANWSDATKFDSDDGNVDVSIPGQVILSEISTSTYASEGYIVSSAYDVGTSTVFNTIEWDEVIDSECELCAIKIQIQTAPDLFGSPGSWSPTWSGPEGEDADETDFFASSTGELIHMDHNGDQWIRFKALLYGEASTTPILEEIRINHKKF